MAKAKSGVSPQNKSSKKPQTKSKQSLALNHGPEREFLHDISTPLSAALLTSSLLEEALREQSNADAKILKMAQNLVRSLDKLNDLVLSKREQLINQDLGDDSQ